MSDPATGNGFVTAGPPLLPILSHQIPEGRAHLFRTLIKHFHTGGKRVLPHFGGSIFFSHKTHQLHINKMRQTGCQLQGSKTSLRSGQLTSSDATALVLEQSGSSSDNRRAAAANTDRRGWRGALWREGRVGMRPRQCAPRSSKPETSTVPRSLQRLNLVLQLDEELIYPLT